MAGSRTPPVDADRERLKALARAIQIREAKLTEERRSLVTILELALDVMVRLDERLSVLESQRPR